MRYTFKALCADLQSINEKLAERGTSKLKADQRNGYTAIDLYEGSRCIREIECGTPKECLSAANDHLAGIITG